MVININTLGIMGGHERISEEFAALFIRAGLTAGRVLPRGLRISRLEAFANLERRPYSSKRLVASRSWSYRLVSGNRGSQDSRRTIQLS